MKIVIDIPEDVVVNDSYANYFECLSGKLYETLHNGTPLPKGHGRIGDLDELEQRISNFVEHDANTTDEYTVIRQRFIVDGIRQTQTIIEADKSESEDES